MGLDIQFEQHNTISFNVYLPCCNSKNLPAFEDYLSRLSGMIDAAGTPNVICMGDFSADPSKNNLFGGRLKSFCQQ